MLKYEKMLHLDQHYEKLQETLQKGNSLPKTVTSVIWSTLSYTIILSLLRYAQNSVPDVCAWTNSKIVLYIGSLTFRKVDIFYYTAGLLTFCYGTIRLQRITCVNHSVRKDDQPIRLITDGYYKNVRHPMYGTFVILYASILLSMDSLTGIMLTIVLVAGQYCNACMEEKKLRNLFGGQFMIYCKKTRLRLLTRGQILTMISVIFLTILGFVI